MSASTPLAAALGSAPSKSIVVKHEDGRTQKFLYLPDTMAEWPWPRMINPYYEEVTLESNAWFKSFKPFTPESQYAYDKCDFGRLASLAYPEVSRGKPIIAWPGASGTDAHLHRRGAPNRHRPDERVLRRGRVH